MRNQVLKMAVAAAVLPFALAGCATFHHVHTMQRSTSRAMASYQTPKAPPVVSTVNTPYLMGAEVDVQHAMPAILRLPVTIRSGAEMSLPEVASAFSSAVGIPVVLGQMHLSSKTGGSLPPLPGQASGGLAQSGGRNGGMFVNWNGSREDFLNAVAAHFSCWWKWRHGEVVFYRIETRTFTIPAFATTETASNSISANSGGSQGGSSGGSMGGASGGSMGGSSGGSMGGSSSGSSGGSSGEAQVSIQNSAHLNIWKNLQKEAETIMGGNGRVFANPSMGTLTVTGTPMQVDSANRWVRALRRQMGRQVSIVVHVYDVQSNSGQSYGMTPTLAFGNAAKSLGVSFQGAPAPSLNSSATGSSAAASPLSIAANIMSGPFSGSGVVLSALATVGTVVNNYTYPVVTLNGQPVAVQSASNTGYLAETSPTIVSQGVATTGGLQPGQVTTGFTAMLTPRVVGDDIYLNMDMTISALKQLQQFTSGGQVIYTPNTTSFSAPQIVKLKSGQTLLLTELVQNSGNIDRNGVGSPKFFLFGGGAAASKGHQMVVITVTARIL
jgi:type IVB pilus formation R64 PilN family outer membrane protein